MCVVAACETATSGCQYGMLVCKAIGPCCAIAEGYQPRAARHCTKQVYCKREQSLSCYFVHHDRANTTAPVHGHVHGHDHGHDHDHDHGRQNPLVAVVSACRR